MIPSHSRKPTVSPETSVVAPRAFTNKATKIACTTLDSTVNPQVMPMFSMPGVSPLPTTAHQAGKNVLGLYQMLPLTMLTTTQATTANQLIELKSMFYLQHYAKKVMKSCKNLDDIIWYIYTCQFDHFYPKNFRDRVIRQINPGGF